MAPNLQQVEQQTFDVLDCLFNDRVLTACFRDNGGIETDGPEDPFDPTPFDPTPIADKLRQVADALNKDAVFQAKLKDLKNEAAKQALDQALTRGVEALVQSQERQAAEVAPELQLIKATVAFGLYLKKTCPDLRGQLPNAIGVFLNQRVGPWITAQGGWERVAAVSQP